MKNNKGIIILTAAVAVCAVGFIVSPLVDWSVDKGNASGNISKSSRFSRKTSEEKITNLEELIQNDSTYKESIVAAQVVMQTRAIQFAALVDMSNEVAGDIPEFAGVLKDMNKISEMVANVNASLTEACKDLDVALGGEECPELTQHTINAALAYTTLQKQNKLADRFIETTDKYLEKAEGNDRLKFVRDQWLEYQQVTAALEGDEEGAEALAEKGNLLSGEKALVAMAGFNLADQMAIHNNCHMIQAMHIDTQLGNVIPSDNMNPLSSAADVTMMQNINTDALGSHISADLRNASGQETLGMSGKHAGAIIFSTTQLSNAVNVISAYSSIINNVAGSPALQQSQNIELGSRIGDVINQTALGKTDRVKPIE